MATFRGEITIADWEGLHEVEAISGKPFQVIRVCMTPFNDNVRARDRERLNMVRDGMPERGVTFQEVRSERGVFVNILAPSASDPIDFLNYAFGMRVLLKERQPIEFSVN